MFKQAENTDLSSLLRRGVHRIVLCQSTDTPLNPKWNVTRKPSSKDVDDELAAFFGVNIDSDTHPGYTYNRNQYFEPADLRVPIPVNMYVKSEKYKTHKTRIEIYTNMRRGRYWPQSFKLRRPLERGRSRPWIW